MYKIKFALLNPDDFVSDAETCEIRGIPRVGDTVHIFGKYPKVSEVSWMTGKNKVIDMVIFLTEQ